MANRDRHGLTKKQRVFAAGLAQGKTQADAYRAAKLAIDPLDDSDLTKGQRATATKWAKLTKVQDHIEKLSSAMTMSDIDDQATAYRALLDIQRDARADKNHNAAVQAQRLRMQAMQMLDQKIVVSQQMDDELLLDRLANGNPAVKSQLQTLLTPDTFEDDTETKH